MGAPEGYVDVAERIREFAAKHPEGSLQQVEWRVEKVYDHVMGADRSFIAFTAAAYRTPDDERPGIGTAWEPFPGPTNFTKDSELMNAETSAWGRAIVAVLASTSRRIATAEDVQNRQAALANIDDVFGKAVAGGAKPDPGVAAVAAAFDAKPVTEADIAAKADTILWPFGKEKGKPLAELTVQTLEWGLANRFDVTDPQWGERNKRTRDAITAELARRNTAAAA